MLQARVCGVEVLLGYCCDKPGSFGPAVPAALFPAGRAQARFGKQCSKVQMPCWDPAWALSIRACCPRVILA